ncbi:Uncharacterised protein [Mycobacteroides abscessus subsp. abscessus]|uniref:Uncharacterized protein n=2 Tax=Mycobacteroides abscessus TaxID=36809 RepID=A0AB38D0P9_9MYCO|nr:hypothetical protein [Mycobacteroides abscessus]SHQ57572.1 Uncharacterised protein [Mycobacteroides abscessus subsp. abscessus]SHY18892.1 Uncharacterised protein [Mycobacteroides abscessus subsp. abscessus]SIA07669.1 Uncharacterised protein [Mycobacteroides abscessus subsp. abscessus]SIA16850.1 Uncharacterised protein [Mycobacteroides abscessus subsp. abscessus]SIB10434.1 Uncharacterised protein [Mycobacteroides abscessus subsp. abscessus]
MTTLGEAVISAVRKEADADPGYVYQGIDNVGCVYVHDGKPSCLVGHGLWAAKLIDSTFEQHTRSFNVEAIELLAVQMGWEFDAREICWLQVVQEKQDDGVAWGDAVKAADKQWGKKI